MLFSEKKQVRSELAIQLMPKTKVTIEVRTQVETQEPTEEKTEVVVPVWN